MTSIKPARFITKPEITAIADRLLVEMRSANCTPKWPQLADLVADYLDLSIVWENFDAVKDGVIAAKIYPTKGEIYINNAFPAIRDNSGLYQSTLAHEIGHWVLHIDLESVLQSDLDASESAIAGANSIQVGTIDRTLPEEVFLCRSLAGDRTNVVKQRIPEEWREWQAQYFASCLLMPLDKLEEVRRGRNLTNRQHLRAIGDELGVTISNLINRLQDLEYLEKGGDSKQLYPGKRLRLSE
jgi:Zn-dependent peptidase ImmA (M78 family)